MAIVAAHNEADIIGQTIEDLVTQDIQVYLLDHASSDGTAAVAQAYVGRGLVRIEPFPDRSIAAPKDSGRFSLSAIIGRKEQLTGELDADWFINHDADEFRESPWSHLNLRQGIELVDYLGFSAIDFQVLNFWPTHDRLPPGGSVREAFRHYAVGDPWDQLQIRCWKNTGQSVELVSTAGHEAQFEGRRIFPIRFLLRHYPIRSQAHGVRKVFEQRLPRFAPEERARGWHVQYEGLQKDHCFIRDPSTLRVYEPETIRVELQLRHRGVEELERRSRELSQRLDETSRALADQQAETVLSQRRIDGQGQELVKLGEALHRQQREAEQQRLGRAAEQRVFNERILDLESRLAAICSSRSWRVTAPLRAARRLLTRGSRR